jgi:hypothetical protein
MIIGVCGFIGSGKGTVADILQHKHGFIKLSFADSLKDAVSSVFGWPRHLLEGDTDLSREFREQVDPWWANRLNINDLTPRLILQLWGTEVCRDGFHKDIWIASMERKLSDTDKNYVIPDCRFVNEVDMIKRMDSEVWCVKRGEDPEWFRKYQTHSIIPEHIHSSEYAWAKSQFDHIITNNGTLQDLEKSVASKL